MKRAIVLDDYQNVALTSADWSTLNGRVAVDVVNRHIGKHDELVEILRGYEIIVAMRERTRFTRQLVESLPDLRLLVSTGPVSAAIDLDAVRELGITVCGTRGYLPPAMELTWALILSCAKQLRHFDRDIKSGRWQTRMGLDIQGARLGVLGLGGYGTRVAAVGKVFGMEIVAWSQNLTQERCQELGVQGLPRDEFFATSDFITIHLRLSDRVIGLVGETELRSMKPSAFLINTSRGPIVEEAALIRALREGWIAGAALDVFDEEPLPLDHPYRTLDNALLTPHVGYVTPRSYRLFYQDAVDTIAAYLDGKTVRALESAPSDPYWWEGEDVQ